MKRMVIGDDDVDDEYDGDDEYGDSDEDVGLCLLFC
jgi:hypothetical protein